MIFPVRRKKPQPGRNPQTGPWPEKKPSDEFHGYPVATIAYYGPTNTLATKVAVSIVRAENQAPEILERWFSTGDLDVRRDANIDQQVLAFLKTHAPRSTIVADRILGCPHEEGSDYPAGTSCPQCPYWAGRDRFTHERVH